MDLLGKVGLDGVRAAAEVGVDEVGEETEEIGIGRPEVVETEDGQEGEGNGVEEGSRALGGAAIAEAAGELAAQLGGEGLSTLGASLAGRARGGTIAVQAVG